MTEIKNAPHFFTFYTTCHRCGALHDDGTFSLCFDCLEFIEDKAQDIEKAREICKKYNDLKFTSEREAYDYEERMGFYE